MRRINTKIWTKREKENISNIGPVSKAHNAEEKKQMHKTLKHNYIDFSSFLYIMCIYTDRHRQIDRYSDLI